MNAFMIPQQTFFANAEVHFPKSFRWSLLRQALKFINDYMIIAMAFIVIN